MSTRLVVLIFAALIVASTSGVRADAPVRTTPFPDVPKTHWAFNAVESLREKGILRGYPPEASKPRVPAKKHAKPEPPSHKRRSA